MLQPTNIKVRVARRETEKVKACQLVASETRIHCYYGNMIPFVLSTRGTEDAGRFSPSRISDKAPDRKTGCTAVVVEIEHRHLSWSAMSLPLGWRKLGLRSKLSYNTRNFKD